MKTMEEVRARLAEIRKDPYPLFDFREEVLQPYLPEEWKDGAEHHHKDFPLTVEFVVGEIRDYLPFGFEKAADEKGLSAIRTVQKLEAWCWLLGRTDLVDFIKDEANYPPYGMPILKRVATAFDFPIPDGI